MSWDRDSSLAALTEVLHCFYLLKVFYGNSFYLLTTMPMEGWVKFESTKHVSGVNSIAAKSHQIQENGDHVFKRKKN